MYRRFLALGVIAALALAAFGQQSQTAHGTVPINFIRGTLSGAGFSTSAPSTLAVGPDGRLYVADAAGRIQALTLDANKSVTAVQQITTNAQLQEVYGIAFDPNDTSSPPAIWVTNTVSGFGDAGQAPAGSYPGKVTKIHGAGYSTITDVITGLPVSNSGHQANGLAFGPDGRLYIGQGSTTNAGVINPNGGLFQREEVPTSAAILVADVNAPGFNGAITYNPANTYSTTVDQTGGDVQVYASGLRNPYDLVFHSNGLLYGTDNGPNAGYGPGSTNCSGGVTPADASEFDELNIIEAGNYYGHPNRNRGRTDARQCVYHPNGEPSSGGYTGALLAGLPASTDGLAEYTAATFGGQMQGDLLMAAWVNSELHRVKLSPDGRSVVEHTTLATGLQNALDVAVGPDGTIYVAEYGANRITYFKPDETPVNDISVTSIQPAAGPVGGGQAVTITGTNFTTSAETTVTIGGQPATNVVVHNSTTITAVTPANTAGAKDVTVTNSIGSATLAGGYQYATGGGTTPPIADAGPDQSTPIAHNTHAHVTIDARNSIDPDGFIVSYEWRENGVLVSQNAVDSLQLELGTHIIELTVTDNDGYTDTDDVRVIVTQTAENPEPYYCFDVDGNGAVNSADLGLVASVFGRRFGQPGYTRLRDWDANGVINSADLGGTAADFTSSCPQVDREVRAATAGMEQFQNIQAAWNSGFFQGTPYIPGQGLHMIKGPIDSQDLIFDPAAPESLLYKPDSTRPGGYRLAGGMWVIPYSKTTLPPDGFTTNDDAWHYHDGLCVWGWNGTGYTAVAENTTEQWCMQRPGNPIWMAKAGWLVHLWNYIPNPRGRFVEVNPNG